MASTTQIDRGPDNDKERNIEIHDVVARWKIAPIRLSDRSQVGDHAAISGSFDEGPGLLRDIRPRLVGLWKDRESRSFCGWRKNLGLGGAPAAGAAEVADTVPHGVEVEWRACDPTKPRHRRVRLYPADTYRTDRQARCQSVLSLQCHYQLARCREWGGATCLRVDAFSSSLRQLRFLPTRHERKAQTLAASPHPTK